MKPSKDVADGTLKAAAEFLATDGLIMKSRLVEKGDASWAILEASTTAEAAQPIKDEAAALNKKLGGWAYKLPEYKQNFLSRKFDDLVEPMRAAEKKEEPPKMEAPPKVEAPAKTEEPAKPDEEPKTESKGG